jgi:hypothetical protein
VDFGKVVGTACAHFEVPVSRCPELKIAIGILNGGSFCLEKRLLRIQKEDMFETGKRGAATASSLSGFRRKTFQNKFTMNSTRKRVRLFL